MNIYRIVIICWSCFIYSSQALYGQNHSFTASGTVTDLKSTGPLPLVNIRVYGTERGAATDSAGKFRILLSRQDSILIFSHTGYKSKIVTIIEEKSREIKVQMEPSSALLPAVDIIAGPEKITTPEEQYIYDYELWYDKIFLITHSGNMNRAKLAMADESGKEISSYPIPGSPNELFSDCLGRIYVLTSEHAYLVSSDHSNTISLTAYPAADFEAVARPCAASYKGFFYFGDYGTGKLSIRYSYVNDTIKKKTVFKEIRDADLQRMYRSEPGKYFDSNGELKKMLGHSARREEDFELHFMRTQVYKPVYAPLKRIGDSLFVFNHYDNALEVFSGNGKLCRQIPITYHTEKKWEKQVITDDSSKKAYTVFLRDGIYDIREINLTDGTLGKSFKMEYPFVEKIRIVNGVLYFLYRPDLETRRKFLYRQKFF